MPGTVHGSGETNDSEEEGAQLCHAELCLSQAGTIIIIIIIAQLRFTLGRKQEVPYYPYMAQLKFLRSTQHFK